jgi:hypothetical protein
MRASSVRVVLKTPWSPRMQDNLLSIPKAMNRLWGNPVLQTRGEVHVYGLPGHEGASVALSADPHIRITLSSDYTLQTTGCMLAHEYSHLLLRYHHSAQPSIFPLNLWFEEVICETAGLNAREDQSSFSTDSVASTVRANQKRWRNKAFSPSDYATFANIAQHLLPLFQEYPGAWRTLASLDVLARRVAQDATLVELLSDWHGHVRSSEDKSFVRRVRALF